MKYSYVKTEFLPHDSALLHIEERGFRFGDGVFETVAVYRGRPYQWELHEARLKRGLSALRISFDCAPLLGLCLQLLEMNQQSDCLLRIYVSRGIGSRGYLPLPSKPTLVIETLDRPQIPDKPVTLWLSDVEKPSPQALPIDCKLAQGVGSTLARLQAQEHDCFEALQCNALGHICEAGAANIFWLKYDRLYTPSLSCGLVDGTTRAAVMRLSPWQIMQGSFALKELQSADAVILTNASMLAVPVAQLLPQGWRWESASLAQQINQRLMGDIGR